MPVRATHVEADERFAGSFEVMSMQDVAAERAFYDELFEKNPENEHITYGYDELYDLAFVREPDGRVLDVGCGTGAHAVRLAQKGFDVVAVDLTRAGVPWR